MARRKKTEDALSDLTDKQRKFILYFTGESNGNATDAARRAGYAVPDPEGSRLLGNARIRSAIDEYLAPLAMSSAEVLSRLSDMARADVADLDGLITFEESENGDQIMSLDLVGARTRGKSRLIKSIRPTRHGVVIELHDAQAALEKLGRYHGLFIERHEIEIDDGGSSDELDRKIDGIAATLGKAPDPRRDDGG